MFAIYKNKNIFQIHEITLYISINTAYGKSTKLSL